MTREKKEKRGNESFRTKRSLHLTKKEIEQTINREEEQTKDNRNNNSERKTDKDKNKGG